MSIVPAQFNDRLTSLGEQYRRFSETTATALLWVLISILFLWAAIFETDLFIAGMIVGSVLALGAIGLTLIYSILGFANFAHGDTMMLGAYVAFFLLTGIVVGEKPNIDLDVGWSLNRMPGATAELWDLSFGWGLLVAIALSMFVMAAFSIGLDRVVYRPLRRRGSGIVIFAMAALGVAFSIRAVMLIIWGPDPRRYVQGIHYANHYPFGVVLKTDQIFIFLVAMGLAAVMYFVLFHSKLGKAMRAMADNPDLALVSGINTDRIVMWTWAIGGGLMAIAGALLAIQALLRPILGFELILPLFAATILGGIGKPQGAFIGALVVGVSQESSIVFFSAGYKPAVAFVILVFILLLRPRGLFGTAS
ncbi:MAG: branched-chain amino acid ABC transporter permease [Chloroflexi bacterium]|nr:branched-chain amino acid ABC transporter permease [Chloroflexota bacterium]